MCHEGCMIAETVSVPRRVALLTMNEAENVTYSPSPPGDPPVILLKRLLNCLGLSGSRPGGAWARAVAAASVAIRRTKARASCVCQPEGLIARRRAAERQSW